MKLVAPILRGQPSVRVYGSVFLTCEWGVWSHYGGVRVGGPVPDVSFPILTSHSKSFTGAQGVPKYKIGFRGKMKWLGSGWGSIT